MNFVFNKVNIVSRNNLTLCKATYFEACWCLLNHSEPVSCSFLGRHVVSMSNSSYFCIFHTIRKAIDCFNSSIIFPNIDSVSSVYISLTTILFVIGLLGNGFSMIILCNRTLRSISVYRNLFLLCAMNIFYLFAVFLRHVNNYKQDLRTVSFDFCRFHTFAVAFTGHLSSCHLVSTSIQRVHALFRLETHQQTSWVCRRSTKIFFSSSNNFVFCF